MDEKPPLVSPRRKNDNKWPFENQQTPTRTMELPFLECYDWTPHSVTPPPPPVHNPPLPTRNSILEKVTWGLTSLANLVFCWCLWLTTGYIVIPQGLLTHSDFEDHYYRLASQNQANFWEYFFNLFKRKMFARLGVLNGVIANHVHMAIHIFLDWIFSFEYILNITMITILYGYKLVRDEGEHWDLGSDT